MSEASGEIREFILQKMTTDLNMVVDPVAVDADSPIGPGGLALESLSLMELVIHLEDRFSVKVADDELERLGAGTLGDLVAHVERLRQTV